MVSYLLLAEDLRLVNGWCVINEDMEEDGSISPQ